MKGHFQGEKEEKRRKNSKNNKKYGILLKEKERNQIVIKRTARAKSVFLERRDVRAQSESGRTVSAVSVPRRHTLHHVLLWFA